MPRFAVDHPVSRAVRRVATSRAFRRVAPSVVPPLDRAVHRLTRGRVGVSDAIVPNLVLTTTGRRSGAPRQSPLACVPDGADGWYVVGSNFGKEHHPAWTTNLIAHPEAAVAFRGATHAVRARLLEDEERGEVWPRLVAVWPAYDDYVAASGRELRVFHLERVGSDDQSSARRRT